MRTNQRGTANPWMIIGWIVLAIIVAPLGLCTAGVLTVLDGGIQHNAGRYAQRAHEAVPVPSSDAASAVQWSVP